MTKERFNSLLGDLKSGNKSAFDDIYNEYYGKMRFVAERILHNDADVNDALQTAFPNLIKYLNADKYGEVKYPGGFMHSLIRNVALNIIKSRKSNISIEDNEDIIDAKYDESAAVGVLDISSVIAGLPDKDREIAIRIFMFDIPVNEVAAELDMSVSAVKWHKKQIRKIISEKIK
ncbi:MAG: sigma-70 family RNA polymerase sigma factor [Clostridiales bacterium]|nr:sigma-70 family RNA polymerase sigma factor [Clostridiales bacterium]